MGAMQFRLACAVALPLLGFTAAEAANYNVQVLSFDMWCQENKRYDAERCDERRPDDVAAFETYRATVERYELPYLKRMEQERELQTRVLEHDSSDRRPGQ
jgi:hypothetical protein